MNNLADAIETKYLRILSSTASVVNARHRNHAPRLEVSYDNGEYVLWGGTPGARIMGSDDPDKVVDAIDLVGSTLDAILGTD